LVAKLAAGDWLNRPIKKQVIFLNQGFDYRRQKRSRFERNFF